MTFFRTYPSHPNSIRSARRALGRFLVRCGCPEPDVFDINLAAAEAVANAIEHGHVPGGEVSIECRFDDDITIVVRDEGGGLREKTWQRVLIKTSLGGYGMALMRGLMDDVSFDIDDDAGATVVMHKRCGWNRSPQYAQGAR